MKRRTFFCTFLSLVPFLLFGSESLATLEDIYTPKYCSQLEAAYGTSLMSEGGVEAIEHMFNLISLENKTALDIGSGLGGVALYLAEKHNMKVTGFDVNTWMVNEAKKRIPESLKNKVDFFLSSSNSHLSTPNENYDIVYSKGVLAHVESKTPLFQECKRLLKDGGFLVINDWLSADEKKWGKNIARLVELEHLPIYAENEKGYIELLKQNGFTLLSAQDDSLEYLQYNREIVERLKDPARRKILLNDFDEKGLQEAIEGYEAIAVAIETGELRVFRFVAQKNQGH